MRKTAYEYWEDPLLPADSAFIDRVRGNITEAHARAIETIGGNMDGETMAGIEAHSPGADSEESNLHCLELGCDNLVNTHKGVGGYCTQLQQNGKTHRQERLEVLKAEGRGPGRHVKTGRGSNQAGKKRGPYKKKVRPAKNFEKVSDNGMVQYLEEINAAYTRVDELRREIAMKKTELDAAETTLRNLLEDEIDKLN